MKKNILILFLLLGIFVFSLSGKVFGNEPGGSSLNYSSERIYAIRKIFSLLLPGAALSIEREGEVLTVTVDGGELNRDTVDLSTPGYLSRLGVVKTMKYFFLLQGEGDWILNLFKQRKSPFSEDDVLLSFQLNSLFENVKFIFKNVVFGQGVILFLFHESVNLLKLFPEFINCCFIMGNRGIGRFFSNVNLLIKGLFNFTLEELCMLCYKGLIEFDSCDPFSCPRCLERGRSIRSKAVENGKTGATESRSSSSCSSTDTTVPGSSSYYSSTDTTVSRSSRSYSSSSSSSTSSQKVSKEGRTSPPLNCRWPSMSVSGLVSPVSSGRNYEERVLSAPPEAQVFEKDHANNDDAVVNAFVQDQDGLNADDSDDSESGSDFGEEDDSKRSYYYSSTDTTMYDRSRR